MTRYTTYIDIGSGYVQCYPIAIDPFRIETFGKYIMRITWGKIKFKNDPLNYAVASNDVYRLYDILTDLESLELNDKVLIKVVTDNLTVIGYFGVNDCEPDDDRKILTVVPAVIDDYTPILENWENEINFEDYTYGSYDDLIVSIPEATVFTVEDWVMYCHQVNSIQYWNSDCMVMARPKTSDYEDDGELDAYFNLVSGAPNRETINDGGRGFMDHGGFTLEARELSLGVDGDNELDFELSGVTIYEGDKYGGLWGKTKTRLYITTKFSRDEQWTIDNPAGTPVSPGASWREGVAGKYQGQSAHFWTRLPFNGAFSDSWTLEDEVENTWGITTPFVWVKKRTSKIEYTTSDFTKTIETSIGLKDFLEYIHKNTHADFAAAIVESTYLFNDNEGDLSILDDTTGVDYVTLNENYNNNSRIAFTKAIKETLNLDEVGAIPKISMKQILEDLNFAYGDVLYWYMDGTTLHIEHERFVDLTSNPKDIRTEDLMEFTNRYVYDKAKLFKRQEFDMTNAEYADFTKNYKTFDILPSNTRNKDLKSNVSTKILSTDLRYMLENSDSIDDGLLYVCVDVNDSNYTVRNRIGLVRDRLEVNGFFALSNLLWDMGRYTGVWEEGTINGKTARFENLSRMKKGAEIMLKGTNLPTGVIPFYKTAYGYGHLVSGEIDVEKEVTKVNLVYRYNSTPDTDVFLLMIDDDEYFEFL